MSVKRTGQSGLSLIELITVMGIIALLSAVAIPQYKKFTSRARMAEAKSSLKAIQTLQLSFYGDFSRYGIMGPTGKLADGTFSCTPNEIEFALPNCGAANSKTRYRYEVTSPTGTTYIARANGLVVDGCITEDVWEIRQDSILRHPTDASIVCR